MISLQVQLAMYRDAHGLHVLCLSENRSWKVVFPGPDAVSLHVLLR